MMCCGIGVPVGPGVRGLLDSGDGMGLRVGGVEVFVVVSLGSGGLKYVLGNLGSGFSVFADAVCVLTDTVAEGT